MRNSILAVVMILTNACAGGDSASSVRIETLPGGATRVTNQAAGQWKAGQEWHLVPLLTLGEVEGDGPAVFGSIADIAVGGDGRIFVLDRQSNELRLFDAAGKHMRSAGRTGQGPGEFTKAFGLELMAGGDSLLVADGQGSRYSIYDRDANYVRSLARPVKSYGWMLEGAYVNGVLYDGGFTASDEAVLIGVRLGLEPELTDTVSMPKLETTTKGVFSVQTERGGMGMTIPHSPSPTWHLSANGTLWWGHPAAYRLVQLSLDRDTLREIVVEGTQPEPVSAAELTEWQESADVKRFKQMGGKLDLSLIPKHKPFFNDLYQDGDGFLWVDVPSASGQTEFDVFDREGRRLGRVTTGINRDRYIKPVVDKGKLYLVGTNELNVPFVFVFRIDTKD